MKERMPGQRFLHQQSETTDYESPDHWAASAPPPVTVQRYRSGAPVLGVIAGVLVIGLAATLVWFGTRPPTGGSTTPSASPTKVSIEPTRAPSPGWQGIDFKPVGSSLSGYWQVSEPTWSGDQVTITTTVT